MCYIYKLQRRKHSQLDVHSKTLSFIDIAQSMQIISSRIVHKPNLSFFLLPRYSLERSGQSFRQQRINTLCICTSSIALSIFFVFNKINIDYYYQIFNGMNVACIYEKNNHFTYVVHINLSQFHVKKKYNNIYITSLFLVKVFSH